MVGARIGAGPSTVPPITRTGDTADPLLGLRVGNAVLESVIGEGGMGVVYAARQDTLDREIAVKVLPPIFNRDASRVRRFLSEAKILSRVNHPHVVTVFDAGETDGMLWIAMERLHGRPLSALLGAGRVPPHRVVALAVQVCDALHATHSAGVTHRDLKPENIFLLPGDRDLVKVLDFGIARSEADHTGTTTGSVTGTPGYMSPEQVLGDGSGPTTDVYSLGVVLYELLAGRRPFEGPPPLVMAAHVRERPPELREIAPGVPPALCAVVMSALQKEPSQRPPTALAFRDALSKASLEPRTRRRWVAGLSIAAVAVAVIGLAAWWDRGAAASPSSPPPATKDASDARSPAIVAADPTTDPSRPVTTAASLRDVAAAATSALDAGPPALRQPAVAVAQPVRPQTADSPPADAGSAGAPASDRGRLAPLPEFSATHVIVDLLTTVNVTTLEQLFTLDADALDAALPGWRTDHFDLPLGFSERVTEVAVPGATRNVELRLQFFGRRLSALSVRLFERDAALEWDVAGALGRPGGAVTDFDGCKGFEWTMGDLALLVRTHRDDEDDPTTPPLHALVVGPAATWRADRLALAERTTVAAAVETAREAIDDGGEGVATGITALVALLERHSAAAAARVELCRARYETGDVTAARRECERVRDASVDLVSRARADYFLALLATGGTTAAAIEAMASLAARLDEAAVPPEARRLKAPVDRRLRGLRGARDDALVTDLFCRRAALVDREVDRATFIEREFGFDEGELDRLADELELDAEDCD